MENIKSFEQFNESKVNEAGTFENGQKFTLKINFKEAKQIISKKAVKVDKVFVDYYDLDLAGGWEDLNGAIAIVKGGQTSFGVTLEITHPETGKKFTVEEFPKNILLK
jgi:maltoporin